ncbi:hypothetical protein [Chitinophaga barathri]|uniref:DUF5018 domain-containing protein n=1 Tax=Chitinophaga barathri TaxID=1647451 RepID=A0A3N4M7K2_9BACT|nr:hypothetical protein [Chitinophaga barathri]RPD39484.1 hypothetical protein EG028_20415 [Chitinophaga barathri]
MIQRLIGCFALATALAACTKTVSLPAEPANRVLEYKISTSDGDLRAVIDESDKTINIYLPYYLYQLKMAATSITLSGGATVQPLSGELVNLRDSTVAYTVSAKDGAKAVYRLKVHVMQVPHAADELSSVTDTFTTRLGSGITITGQNFLADTTLAYISLIDKNGKEHRLPRGTPQLSTTKMDGLVPNDKTLDTGLYKVKITSLKESVVLTYPVRLKYALPVFNVGEYKVTASQGGTIRLPGRDIRGLQRFAIRIATTGGIFNLAGYKDLEIVSYTDEEAILRIPEDCPPGAYPQSATASLWHYIVFEEKGPEFYGAGGFQITVTAK